MDPEVVLEMIKKKHSCFLGIIDLIPEVGGFSSGQVVEWKDEKAKDLLFNELGQGPFEIVLVIRTTKWEDQVVVLGRNGYPVPVHPSFFSLAAC